jgi:hypothetical protein
MKINFNNGVAEFNENGEYETDIVTKLPHRLTVVDGIVVDKYPGMTDNEVRVADHVTAGEFTREQQALWDDAPENERFGDRPQDLPELDLPEEE